MKETVLERKRRWIRDIQKAHTFYSPESHVSQKAAKAMEKLPEQAVFYLWHLPGCWRPPEDLSKTE